MAYIEPNSVIQLLSGCPLDKGYKNTIYFKTPLEQTNYFQSLQEATLTKSSYQRWDDGVIHVNFPTSVCLRCNYLMFQNTAYSGKWFYAFIDSVDYVNNNCTKITFTIDIMQTWYFNYNILPSFVEREHTETDEIYEHTLPEQVEIGDLICARKDNILWGLNDSEYSLVIQYIPGTYKVKSVGFNPDGSSFEERYPVEYDTLIEAGTFIDESYKRYTMVNNLFQGCVFFSMPLKNNGSRDILDNSGLSIPNVINKIISVIQFIIGENKIIIPDKVGTIISMFIAPKTITDLNDYEISSTSIKQVTYNPLPYFIYKGTTNRYYPKNNKLLNYPYKQTHISNNSGSTTVYNNEEFMSGVCKFNIGGAITGQCDTLLYPVNYKGISDNYEEGLILNNFPFVSWNEDSFTKWWGLNKDSFIYSSLMDVVSKLTFVPPRYFKINPSMGDMENYTRTSLTSTGAVPRLTGETLAPSITRIGAGVIGRPIDIMFSVLNSINTIAQQMSVPNNGYGDMSIGALSYCQGRLCFTYFDMGIDGETAEIIDNYFNMFGYTCKKIKIPNIKFNESKLRPHWNYIQTVNCLIKPVEDDGMPADDMVSISNIYDNGITFWMNGNDVGNYTLDNRPTNNVL